MKLQSALELVKDHEIEGISDLRILLEDGSLESVGFAKITLSMIKTALGSGKQGATASIYTELEEAETQERQSDQPSQGEGLLAGAVAAVRGAVEARAADKLAASEAQRAEEKAQVGRRALHEAAQAGDETQVRRLLDDGCEVNWVRLLPRHRFCSAQMRLLLLSPRSAFVS